MTDDYLDDFTAATLARELRELARLLPEALRIAHRETSPPGGRAARNPNPPSSQAPIRVGALGAHDDTREMLRGWSTNLADDTGIELPPNRDAPTLAIHLARNTHAIAQRPWADDCRREIRTHWNRIRFSVDPPDAKYIGPCQAIGKPQCRGLFSGDGRDDSCGKCGAHFDLTAVRAATEERIHVHYRERNGTPMELAHMLREMGLKVSNKKITYWARRGLIAKRGEVRDGPRVSPLYNLGETETVFYRTGGKRPAQQVESR